MPIKRLYRSRENRMICGLAAGVGDFLGIDPTVVRLLWVVAGLAGLVPAVVVYLAGCLLVPDEPLFD